MIAANGKNAVRFFIGRRFLFWNEYKFAFLCIFFANVLQ
ncbi:hypothetical protein B4168_3187 [Anoxybacillus flavithermus]|nr:hypothetical protein B4168_3187 [Anoxybacillus flavithermus]OAO88393.1 hypothetical protein GT23_0361 [Parageobacillus thermoglucosidasius]